MLCIQLMLAQHGWSASVAVLGSLRRIRGAVKLEGGLLLTNVAVSQHPEADLLAAPECDLASF